VAARRGPGARPMFGGARRQTPERIGFLLIADFSMIAFTSSVEPLRMANRLAGQRLYDWRLMSVDGQPVRASNGVTVIPDAGLDDVVAGEIPIVCAGINVAQYGSRRIDAWLRAAARGGAMLGAVCTGSLLLARAGLLDGHRCTIHWEDMESFAEAFPDLDITATLFEIDRDRFTCSGGTAPLDMMVHGIALDHGHALAVGVAEELLHAFMRHPYDPQRTSLQHRTGISHPKLLAAITQMEAFLEAPVSLAELAANAGASTRQLERLFHDHLGTTPSRYYLELRLQRAWALLHQTALPIMQVAVACGFASASHFAKCYRAHYGHTPRAERSAGGPAETAASAN